MRTTIATATATATTTTTTTVTTTAAAATATAATTPGAAGLDRAERPGRAQLAPGRAGVRLRRHGQVFRRAAAVRGVESDRLERAQAEAGRQEVRRRQG